MDGDNLGCKADRSGLKWERVVVERSQEAERARGEVAIEVDDSDVKSQRNDGKLSKRFHIGFAGVLLRSGKLIVHSAEHGAR